MKDKHNESVAFQVIEQTYRRGEQTLRGVTLLVCASHLGLGSSGGEREPSSTGST